MGTSTDVTTAPWSPNGRSTPDKKGPQWFSTLFQSIGWLQQDNSSKRLSCWFCPQDNPLTNLLEAIASSELRKFPSVIYRHTQDVTAENGHIHIHTRIQSTTTILTATTTCTTRTDGKLKFSHTVIREAQERDGRQPDWRDEHNWGKNNNAYLHTPCSSLRLEGRVE